MGRASMDDFYDVADDACISFIPKEPTILSIQTWPHRQPKLSMGGGPFWDLSPNHRLTVQKAAGMLTVEIQEFLCSRSVRVPLGNSTTAAQMCSVNRLM